MKANVVQLDNSMPREKWVKRISVAWREQLPSIFETGNLLEAAQAELKHGEWGAMFQKGELPFTRSTAFRLMAIACNDNVRNDAHAQHLPSVWTVLYELTKLTDEQFENGISGGAINPQMQRKDVKALRGIEPKKKEKEPDPVGLSDPERACVDTRKIIVAAMKPMSLPDQAQFIALIRLQLDDIEATRKAA